jgi:hypothetical protein
MIKTNNIVPIAVVPVGAPTSQLQPRFTVNINPVVLKCKFIANSSGHERSSKPSEFLNMVCFVREGQPKNPEGRRLA